MVTFLTNDKLFFFFADKRRGRVSSITRARGGADSKLGRARVHDRRVARRRSVRSAPQQQCQ